MTKAMQSSNKAKIARRVVEVLEFFDDEHPEATVMDIVRRYNRPQSSTSELLSSLVELGLLHKDPYARSYRPTARAALLGSSGQPKIVSDGRLSRLLDRLVSHTGHSVLLLGMVGLDAQVVAWRKGTRGAGLHDGDIAGGMKDRLTSTAAGWLMLSTQEPSRRAGMLRHINAEADEGHRFNHAEILSRVAECEARKYTFGPVGFGTDAQIVCGLVPQQPDADPLVVAIVHDTGTSANRESLLQCMGDAMRDCLPDPDSSNIEKFPTAA